MTKKPSRKSLINRLDKEFSLYIRRRFANNGYVECFTCGKKDHWRSMDCGHFMSRKHYATRWDENNCQVQCKGCNIFRYGEQFRFGINLNKKYGEGTAENLERESRVTTKLMTIDLIDKIKYYKEINRTFKE